MANYNYESVHDNLHYVIKDEKGQFATMAHGRALHSEQLIHLEQTDIQNGYSGAALAAARKIRAEGAFIYIDGNSVTIARRLGDVLKFTGVGGVAMLKLIADFGTEWTYAAKGAPTLKRGGQGWPAYYPWNTGGNLGTLAPSANDWFLTRQGFRDYGKSDAFAPIFGTDQNHTAAALVSAFVDAALPATDTGQPLWWGAAPADKVAITMQNPTSTTMTRYLFPRSAAWMGIRAVLITSSYTGSIIANAQADEPMVMHIVADPSFKLVVPASTAYVKVHIVPTTPANSGWLVTDTLPRDWFPLQGTGTSYTGGWLNYGGRLDTGCVIGLPPATTLFRHEGAFKYAKDDAGRVQIALGDGVRALEYEGKVLSLYTASQTQTQGPPITDDDEVVLNTSLIRTYLYTRVQRTPKDPMGLTDAAAQAQRAEMDIGGQTFQAEDAEKGIKLVTFKQANDRASDKQFTLWYGVIPAVATMQTGTIELAIVTATTTSITIMDHLDQVILTTVQPPSGDVSWVAVIDAFRSGWAVVNIPGSPDSANANLARALSMSEAELLSSPLRGVGMMAEFNEGALLANHFDPMTLPPGRAASLHMLQYVNDRSGFGKLPGSVAAYARAEARAMKLHLITKEIK